MKISVFCDSVEHPVNEMLLEWCEKQQTEHEITLTHSKEDLAGGNILFLISCNEVISSKVRAKFDKTLVIHASDLPKGRGWSPHIWEIVDGAESITIVLLEAEDKVDCGAIWKKLHIPIPKHALHDEINRVLFKAESDLMSFAVENFSTARPSPQNASIEPSYYSKRSPEHSEIDPNKSLLSQFDLLRVCDPVRYPAYFKLHGCRYKIVLEKEDDE